MKMTYREILRRVRQHIQGPSKRRHHKDPRAYAAWIDDWGRNETPREYHLVAHGYFAAPGCGYDAEGFGRTRREALQGLGKAISRGGFLPAKGRHPWRKRRKKSSRSWMGAW